MIESGHCEHCAQTPKRLYNAREAGQYLGLSEWTTRDMIADGRIPAIRVGRRVLVDIRDLDAWIERSKSRADS